MHRPRVIPVLLLRHAALVKTERFANARYIGDAINAVKIFNDLRADELVLLDIDASREQRTISTDLIKSVGEEADMPFAAGGGIRSLRQVRDILAAGAEKVVIGSYAAENPKFVEEAATRFGSSTIVVCIDVKTDPRTGERRVWTMNSTRRTQYDAVEFARSMQSNGAGEIIVQAIDRDGTMKGYDIDLIRSISVAVEVPVVALGGAGTVQDFHDAHVTGLASALAAGSMFVFHGKKRGVLINYPRPSELVGL